MGSVPNLLELMRYVCVCVCGGSVWAGALAGWEGAYGLRGNEQWGVRARESRKGAAARGRRR